jgi:hypothetical protein
MFISLTTKPENNKTHRRVEIINKLLGLHKQKKIKIIISTMAIIKFQPYQKQTSHIPELAKFINNLFNSTNILLYEHSESVPIEKVVET